jgi:hypothetical protein
LAQPAVAVAAITAKAKTLYRNFMFYLLWYALL